MANTCNGGIKIKSFVVEACLKDALHVKYVTLYLIVFAEMV